ncbi:M56 family metallopeptidase [Paraflavisolibacter sp. H34]|uniref:M56 family metallopeptidase n=1 Tax=Huijunlia imazamoxiresistens TaxID=3127457 RepID=UPI003015A319
MLPFAIYLLKVIACSGALYLYYVAALRNRGFHRWNRFYLLAATLLSVLIPFIEIPVGHLQDDSPSRPVQVLQVVTAADNYTAEMIAPANVQEVSFESVAGLLYGGVGAVLAFFFLRSLLRIRQILRNGTLHRAGHLKLVYTHAPGTPFSWLRYIFWNPALDPEHETGRQILQHELVHVQERHSLDKLWMQTLLIVFWCNPVFWLMRKELGDLHEFLADRKAVGAGGAPALAAMILQAAYPGAFPELATPFFQSSIKRRLAMLTTNQPARPRYFSRILVLPVLALTIASFAVRVTESPAVGYSLGTDTLPRPFQRGHSYHDTRQGIILEADSLVHHQPAAETKLNATRALFVVNGRRMGPSVLEQKTIIAREVHFYTEGHPDALKLYGQEAKRGVLVFEDAKVYDIPMRSFYKEVLEGSARRRSDPEHIVFTKAEVDPQFKGGEQAWQRYVRRTLNTDIPTSHDAPRGRYTTEVRIVVDRTGNLSDVQALTQHGYGMEQEALRVVHGSRGWVPARQNGHAVNAYKTLAITFTVK